MEENIKIATTYIFLACLDCKDSLTLYPNPIQEIKRHCDNYKKRLASFVNEKDVSDPFPPCLSRQVKQELVDRIKTGNWTTPLKSVQSVSPHITLCEPHAAPYEKERLINKFLQELSSSITGNQAQKLKGLLLQADNEFIIKLEEKKLADRKELLLQWGDIAQDIAKENVQL